MASGSHPRVPLRSTRGYAPMSLRDSCPHGGLTRLVSLAGGPVYRGAINGRSRTSTCPTKLKPSAGPSGREHVGERDLNPRVPLRSTRGYAPVSLREQLPAWRPDKISIIGRSPVYRGAINGRSRTSTRALQGPANGRSRTSTVPYKARPAPGGQSYVARCASRWERSRVGGRARRATDSAIRSHSLARAASNCRGHELENTLSLEDDRTDGKQTYRHGDHTPLRTKSGSTVRGHGEDYFGVARIRRSLNGWGCVRRRIDLRKTRWPRCRPERACTHHRCAARKKSRWPG